VTRAGTPSREYSYFGFVWIVELVSDPGRYLMKKLMWLTVAIVMIALPACGGGSESSGENVVLRYAIWDENQAPAMRQIAKQFTKDNENVQVKIEVTPFDQYFTKLEAAAQGGALPDVFWLSADSIELFASNDQLLPLTDRIEDANVDLGNYPSPLVDLYEFEGDNYALPKDFDTIGLWYNKQLFDKAGISYPDTTWDWDKFIDAAVRLTDQSKGIYGTAARLLNQEGYYNTIYQQGGCVVCPGGESGYDSPEVVEGLKFWTDLIFKYKVSPSLADMTETDPVQMFESGKVAMLWAGSWMQIEFAKNAYTRDKVDVTVLPKGDQRGVVIHGLGNVIGAGIEHPEEAWEFVKFLGSKEAADIQAKTGTVIPAFNGTQSDWVKSNPNFDLQVFIDQLAYSKPYAASATSSEWHLLETEVLAKAWTGESSVEQVAQQLAKDMNGVLAEESEG